jgi:SET domain-containing protein
LIIWECEDTGERRVAVHAIQEIQSGGELTIDYAWSADVAINCLCGAPSCRGWIVDREQLEAHSQMRSA